MPITKIPISGLLYTELQQQLQNHGWPRFRADQVFHWIQKKGIQDWDEANNFPGSLRENLRAKWRHPSLLLLQEQQSKDGTKKYLLEASDGQTIETVMIPDSSRSTVCVSSQVGCAMGCTFCATGQMGFHRQLSTAEIVSQVLLVQAEQSHTPVSHIVLMGMGEPLANYDSVLKALHLLHDPRGMDISWRRMTLSTCGLVPEIIRLSEENLPLTLAVSLHAPDNERRSQIMPINAKYPLEALLPACRKYSEATGRRVTFEYALVDGFNDSDQDANALAEILQHTHGHVNIIPINPVIATQKAPGQQRVKTFLRLLQRKHVAASLRKERGADIDGACGQLRQREESSP